MAKTTGDSLKIEVWGSDRVAQGASALVAPSQSTIEKGFVDGIASANDFTWVPNVLGAKINHVLQNGVPLWNATTAYVAGNVVTDEGAVWVALASNTNSNPSDVNANWDKLITSSRPNFPNGYINTAIPQYAGVQSITLNGTASAKSGDDLYNLQAVGSNTVSLGFAGLNGLATGTVANNTWYYLYLVAQGNGLAGGYLFDTAQGAVSHTLNTENRVLWSEDLSQATWVKNGSPSSTVTSDNLISPSGVLNADTVADSTDTANSSIQQDFTAGSTTSTLLFYAKRGSTDWLRIQFAQSTNRVNLWVNLATGALGTQNTGGTAPTGISVASQNAGNGWYRIAITATFASTALRCVFNTASADASNTRVSGASYSVWGVQCVNGSVVVPYTKTDGTIVTGTTTLRSRQLPLAVRTDGSSNIIPFKLSEWTGRFSELVYDVTYDFGASPSTGTTRIASVFNNTSFTSVSASSFVPPMVRMANFITRTVNGVNSPIFGYREASGKAETQLFGADGAGPSVNQIFDASVTSSQAIEFKIASNSMEIFVTGYKINL